MPICNQSNIRAHVKCYASISSRPLAEHAVYSLGGEPVLLASEDSLLICRRCAAVTVVIKLFNRLVLQAIKPRGHVALQVISRVSIASRRRSLRSVLG